MQRDLVERAALDLAARTTARGSRSRSSRPGPLAAQLAIYLGWVRGRHARRDARGGRVRRCRRSSWCSALSALYLRYGGLLVDAGRVLRRRRGRDRDHRAQRLQARAHDARAGSAARGHLFAVSALVTAWTESEIVWVFVAGGAVGARRLARPRLGGSLQRSRRGPLALHRACTARRADDALAHLLVLRRGGRVRVRQRARDRAVPARRRRRATSTGSPSASSSTRSRSR